MCDVIACFTYAQNANPDVPLLMFLLIATILAPNFVVVTQLNVIYCEQSLVKREMNNCTLTTNAK